METLKLIAQLENFLLVEDIAVLLALCRSILTSQQMRIHGLLAQGIYNRVTALLCLQLHYAKEHSRNQSTTTHSPYPHGRHSKTSHRN